jgi:eukaryotic-like serine/threonine-protein kinase
MPSAHSLRDARTIPLGEDRELELDAVVGQGSGAIVWRAYLRSPHRVLRPVAVKIWRPAATEEADHMFAVLTSAVGRVAYVQHPNVVHAYECGMWAGHPFLVMEVVEGSTLAAMHAAYRRKHRRMPLDLALFVATEVAEGLSGARLARDADGVALGVIHGALGMSDVLLSIRGEVKVSDFETCLLGSASSSVRSLRAIATRIVAMAPEVAHGASPDARADVFSLGVLLRELFVGPRFPSPITQAEALALAREGYVEPLTFQPHLPRGLADVIERSLAVDPGQRYANASRLAYDLRRQALVLGVGDGRAFLRSAIARELLPDQEEATREHHIPTLVEDEAARRK